MFENAQLWRNFLQHNRRLGRASKEQSVEQPALRANGHRALHTNITLSTHLLHSNSTSRNKEGWLMSLHIKCACARVCVHVHMCSGGLGLCARGYVSRVSAGVLLSGWGHRQWREGSTQCDLSWILPVIVWWPCLLSLCLFSPNSSSQIFIRTMLKKCFCTFGTSEIP
jgi:hypothetical protein